MISHRIVKAPHCGWPRQAAGDIVRDMRSPFANDRLAILTHTDAGEEIPFGDPSVTDAERAAAGRETLAHRRQELLGSNRRRASGQYTAPGVPDGEETVRVWCPRDPAGLRDRLGGEELAVWADGDILHVLWQGDADEVQLIAGVQPRLWPVQGAAGLWEASLRIRRLDEAVITIAVAPGGQPVTRPLVWRGSRAPAGPPRADPLTGLVEDHTLDSAALGAARGVTVYRPPGTEGQVLPGCVLADGQSVPSFAGVLEPAILAGAVPPAVLVGIHHDAGRRAQEYIRGYNRRRFAAHLGFVTGEVIPWAASRFGARELPWVAAGYSNGAAWAIGAAQRRPDVFTAVAAFSAGVVPRQIAGPARTARVRHYLAAGTLEAGFSGSTRRWAGRLRRAGLPCHHQEWVGGHDAYWWEQQLPGALAWLLDDSASGVVRTGPQS
jgi:enterochelin esterase-like enzyme